ncbi:40S ribosomal protein S6-A-like [Pyrus ussuriensis x Pyrus communis]|uniref:40S ribosomal protein S6-A-like n=1 Tax=Pyrus ussuriensis x Pyrus communis TaxID=2448454 RepID=A0A5N5I8U2_9ROSA|nr:40S ribosomal protein S6-A-like [Pyrus ussuriensis x Pyrus communis]
MSAEKERLMFAFNLGHRDIVLVLDAKGVVVADITFECFFVNGRTELVVAHELAQYAVRADDFKSGI